MQFPIFCSLTNSESISLGTHIWTLARNSIKALKLVSTIVHWKVTKAWKDSFPAGQMTIHTMPAWSPTFQAACWWLASQLALSSILAFWQAHRFPVQRLKLRGDTQSDTALFTVPHWQPARLHYTGSLFQLPSRLYHLRVWKSTEVNGLG